MIDIILFIAVLGIWYGGFWCGSRYTTIGNMCTRIKKAWSGGGSTDGNA